MESIWRQAKYRWKVCWEKKSSLGRSDEKGIFHWRNNVLIARSFASRASWFCDRYFNIKWICIHSVNQYVILQNNSLSLQTGTFISTGQCQTVRNSWTWVGKQSNPFQFFSYFSLAEKNATLCQDQQSHRGRTGYLYSNSISVQDFIIINLKQTSFQVLKKSSGVSVIFKPGHLFSSGFLSQCQCLCVQSSGSPKYFDIFFPRLQKKR